MKMFKRTLTLFLALAVMTAALSTVAFAAEATEFPAEPEVAQMYARMQHESTILTTSSRNSTYGYDRGQVGNTGGGSPAYYHPNVTAGFIHETAYSVNTSGGLRRQGNEILFEAPGTDTLTKVTSGYIMAHTSNVKIPEAPSGESGFSLTFAGGGDSSVSGGNMYWDNYATAWVHMGTDGKVELKFSDEDAINDQKSRTDFLRDVDVSAWVKAGTAFDMKVLYNVTDDVYDVYIDNMPVMLSVDGDSRRAETTGIGALVIYGFGPETYGGGLTFGTTNCYPMTEAEVAQFRQAAWETAFNRSVDTADGTLPLFIGEEGVDSNIDFDDFNAMIDGKSTDKMILKCDNVTGIKIGKGVVGTLGLHTIYLDADDMTQYSYDNLEYILASEPVLDEANGTYSGTYISAGGKSNAPTAFCALYTEDSATNAQMLVKVSPNYSSNGVYSAALEIDENVPDGAIPAFMLWGGTDRMTPLFPALKLDAIEQ